LTTRELDGVTIIDVEKAKITLDETYLDLREFVAGLLERGTQKILINLANVNYIDSNGLGDLLGCYTSATRQKAKLKLLKTQERVCDLLIATKLIGVFEIFNDESKAIRSFQPEGEH
jgi:anti-sigma B factor antagonist